MRKPSACTACRSRRRKCRMSEGQRSCTYCDERGIPCLQVPPEGGFYERRAQQRSQAIADAARDQVGPAQHPRPHLEQPFDGDSKAGTPSHAMLPGLAMRLDLVRLYFDYIHDQFHSLFHRPSFVEDVLSDRVPSGILFAIAALSSRFSTDPYFADVDPRDRGIEYLREAEATLELRNPSLASIQLCVLIGTAWTARGQAQAENLYYGIACRMAQLMDLPNAPTSSILESEIHLRVWWSLSMIDVWSSTAVKLPTLLPARTDLPLPMDDLVYLSLSPTTGSPSSSTCSPLGHGSAQLVSQMVKVNRILMEINAFNQHCVTANPSWDELEHGVEMLTARLDGWLAGLPRAMQDTPENFAWFASRGLGRIFAAVYLGYYHYGQLLYYQFLHGAVTDPAPTATTPGTPSLDRRHDYARRCKEHAARLCETVYRAHATPGADVRYTMTSHVLVIASTVQIHTLLFSGDEDDIGVARRRLERNFELLLQLQTYWPTVDRAISRLRAFHATARTGVDSSFVLDRWMLRFLVEFAESMEEKEADAWRGASEEMEALWSRA